MHERAMIALSPLHDFAERRNGSLRRAGEFFSAALIPMEEAHHAARNAVSDLRQRNEVLRRHTAALTTGYRRLKREVTRRKAGELAVRKSRLESRELLRESQAMQIKMRLLTRQIISAQEEERKEISRELHDEIVQTLVGINVELSILGKGTAAGLHHLRAKIARTQRLVENSVRRVHRFARELRPAVLDDLGLIPALHAYSRSLAERKHLKIQMTAFAGVEKLAAAKRTVLFRVAQEALTNVARHAQASRVRILIAEVADRIRMEIFDNGRAFSVRKALLAKSPGRLGLIGMRERMEMVGGRLTIESTPGTGTMVRAEVPFTQDPAKA